MPLTSIIPSSFDTRCCFQPLTLFIFVYINLVCFHHVKPTSNNETDYLALLKVKGSITYDPENILSSWNSSNHFCSWTGITCGHKHMRVTKLNLAGHHLGGTISPHVGNLSFLMNLSLTDNNLHGKIPQELGRLFRLKVLFLSNNTLMGEIPLNLTSCTEMRRLFLGWNSLTGKIPYHLGDLQKIDRLQLSHNNFSGEIPLSIRNLTFLSHVTVAYNNLEGSIPDEIGHLKNLQYFGATMNSLSGSLPSSIYNISSLIMIAVAMNHLNMTQLPQNIFSTLPNLVFLALGGNQIYGTIPSSITNASSLQKCDFSFNRFVGKVPNLGGLKDLVYLNLGANDIGSSSNGDLDFMTSLTNCSKLEILGLSSNRLGGILPKSIGNLSTLLIELTLGGNNIYGTIPSTLGKFTILNSLGLENNEFSGIIPTSLGKLHYLKEVYLGGNHLLGEIPASLGNLSGLISLSISRNKLEGKIPTAIGNMESLLYLDLSVNNFVGAIPFQIFDLNSLSILLNLSHNSLNGSLPIEIGKLKNLGSLDISENNLSGEIPSSIGECTRMEQLDLHGNSFNGPLPSSLVLMKGLTHLDLSQNNLSGSIPIGLQNISFLQFLNLSFNMFTGEVPTEGVFNNTSALSVIGNINLCGGISKLHLPPCPKKIGTQGKHNFKLMIIVICLPLSLLLIFCLAFYWTRQRSKKSSSTSIRIEQIPMVSYQNLHIATDGFSTNNLIGSGSYGSVYKGRLEIEDRVVAIKVFNLQKKGAQKSFISECTALKNLRHRNLVKILTCCSSVDYKGEEFKALVFKYMSNGSLENWLHPHQQSANWSSAFDINQRLNVIYDVATAVHYLHYEIEQPVIHCDLKPSNVLIDDDMVARVGDFGIAKLLATLNKSSQTQTSTSGIKGTIGYTPPGTLLVVLV